MNLFLPPAPHTRAFFDNIRQELSHFQTEAATYPGYGDVPSSGPPSIENYAKTLRPLPSGTCLIGFHTGCLVALEMARQQPDLGPLILVDIPFFDEATKTKRRNGFDAANVAHAAFFAAFDYDLTKALVGCRHKVSIIATDSSLYDFTLKAAKLIPSAELIAAKNISKPAFDHPHMAILLRSLLVDNSQINQSAQT